MAARIGATPFAEILPNSLAADETTSAIAESLDSAIEKLVLALPGLLVYARLALAETRELLPPLQRLADLAGGLSPIPEPLLDLLAWQFHVDGYEAAVTYDDKRRLVDRSILMHRRKGTPWAVTEALRSLGYADARIFEGGSVCKYNGEINYDGHETYAAGNRWALFDVEIDLGDGMGVSAASVLRLRVAIEAWKNARSHLRAIRWSATVSDNLDMRELLDCLCVNAQFSDIKPWGFPCYDGSIQYDNGAMRTYDGRLSYDGSFPHYFWQAGQYRYNNLVDPLALASNMSLAEEVRPILNYDAFARHNGGVSYGHNEAPALEIFSASAGLEPFSEFAPVADAVESVIQPKILDRMFHCHDGSLTYGPRTMNGAFNYDGSRSYDSGVFLRYNGHIPHDGTYAYNRWFEPKTLYEGPHDSCVLGASFALSDRMWNSASHSGEAFFDGQNFYAAPEPVDDLSLSIFRHVFANGKTFYNASKKYCQKELV